jgi:hypothetical protein
VVTRDDDPKMSTETLMAILREMDKRYEQRWSAIDRATQVALSSNEKRLDTAAEFREQLADQVGLCLPRAEFNRIYEATNEKMGDQMRAMETRIGDLRTALDEGAGQRSGMTNSWRFLVGLVAVANCAVTIAVLLLRH